MAPGPESNRPRGTESFLVDFKASSTMQIPVPGSTREDPDELALY